MLSEDRCLSCRSLADFRLMKKVGEGALSEVYHAQHTPSGTTVALKLYAKVSLTQFTRRQIEREIELQSDLRHRHIVQLVRMLTMKSVATSVLPMLKSLCVD
jgi:serine/threonine protein kinase